MNKISSLLSKVRVKKIAKNLSYSPAPSLIFRTVSLHSSFVQKSGYCQLRRCNYEVRKLLQITTREGRAPQLKSALGYHLRDVIARDPVSAPAKGSL